MDDLLDSLHHQLVEHLTRPLVKCVLIVEIAVDQELLVLELFKGLHEFWEMGVRVGMRYYLIELDRWGKGGVLPVRQQVDRLFIDALPVFVFVLQVFLLCQVHVFRKLQKVPHLHHVAFVFKDSAVETQSSSII